MGNQEVTPKDLPIREYNPIPGENIGKTCQSLVQIVEETGHPATAEFNDVRIVAKTGMTAGDLQQFWQTEMDRRSDEYRASPEGQQAERQREESQKKAEESAKEGILAFDVVDEAAWNKWRESNEDGGYSEACLRYAARWAHLMDVKLADGEQLEHIADSTSHEADTEGITGFMYGAAVSMLSQCWRHGDALRHWHNLSTQIADEGEKANKQGGVLNPAVLRIG